MSEKGVKAPKRKSVEKCDSLSNSIGIGSSAYLCVCMALVAIYGIWRYFSVKDQPFGSLLVLPVFFVYRSVYQSVLSVISQKTISRQKAFFLLTSGLSLVFSLCMTWGVMLDTNNCFSSAWDCAVMTFCLFFALYPCIWFITRKLDDFAEGSPAWSVIPANPRLIRNTKRICFVIIVIIWLLIYLGMYPGLYGYDAPYFMQQYMYDAIAVRIYPAYTTVFYKLFCLGLNLGGSNESALALVMALQGVLSLFGIWRILCFLETYIFRKNHCVYGIVLYDAPHPRYSILLLYHRRPFRRFLFHVCDSLDPNCSGPGCLLERSQELAVIWRVDGSSVPNPAQRHICATGFCCVYSILPQKDASKDYFGLFIRCPHFSDLPGGHQ